MADPWPDVPLRSWKHWPPADELLPGVLKEAHAKADTLAGSGLSSLAAFPASPMALTVS